MKLSALALTLIALGASAVADEATLTAQSTSVSLTIPGPAWSASAKESIQTGVSGLGKPISITEFIPQEQNFDNWQELFAIMIEEQTNLTLDQYKEQQIGRARGACKLDTRTIFEYSKQPTYKLFVVPCSAYLSSPTNGEVAVFFMTRANGHLIKVYHHFRGPAFEAMDVGSWPMSTVQLDTFLKSLPELQIQVQ